MRCVEGDFRAAVKAAVLVLRAGGVIAYPTETTYGLGCDPRNAAALAKIYAIKSREEYATRFLERWQGPHFTLSHIWDETVHLFCPIDAQGRCLYG